MFENFSKKGKEKEELKIQKKPTQNSGGRKEY